MLAHTVNELFCNAKEVTCFLEWYRIEPAIIVFLARIKELMKDCREFLRQDTCPDEFSVKEGHRAPLCLRGALPMVCSRASTA